MGKEESTINFRKCLNKLNLYKSVIDEVSEWVDTHDIDDAWELIEILDKAKGE